MPPDTLGRPRRDGVRSTARGSAVHDSHHASQVHPRIHIGAHGRRAPRYGQHGEQRTHH